jgi:NAD(P)-dependent dehydrogenase (short-subunit alcohol dehydrogenase family)
MQIEGKVALVAGGASGLGEATARRLAAEGARVVVADLDPDRASTVAAEIDGVPVVTDVTDEGSVEHAIAEATKLGELRIAVNTAGIGSPTKLVARDGPTPLRSFAKVIEVNLLGTINVLRCAAGAMLENEPLGDQERGVCVNTASIAAYEGQVGQVAYAASKAGVVGLTLPVARDLSASGIRVNTVAPGLIDTPIYGEGEGSEAFKAKLGESVLFPHRLGKPEELASMVIELITNSYMNAEVVRVDGGIRMPPK